MSILHPHLSPLYHLPLLALFLGMRLVLFKILYFLTLNIRIDTYADTNVMVKYSIRVQASQVGIPVYIETLPTKHNTVHTPTAGVAIVSNSNLTGAVSGQLAVQNRFVYVSETSGIFKVRFYQ